ncbi:MAG: flavin reductase [Nocardiopsaceae bacterium]|nr:flavin reductase [Nocardiopsaceae bacterium]
MRIDPRMLRTCLGHFATGVTVVSCDTGDAPHGATVNSFTAVSLEPPLVLVALDRRTRLAGYMEGRPFTVNVLGSRQGGVARHFAGTAMAADSVAWERPDLDLAPRLAGALATISCRPWHVYDGGDHRLFLGEVAHFDVHGGEPLVFYRGRLGPLGPAHQAAPWLESGDGPELSWFPFSA